MKVFLHVCHQGGLVTSQTCRIASLQGGMSVGLSVYTRIKLKKIGRKDASISWPNLLLKTPISHSNSLSSSTFPACDLQTKVVWIVRSVFERGKWQSFKIDRLPREQLLKTNSVRGWESYTHQVRIWYSALFPIATTLSAFPQLGILPKKNEKEESV